MKKKNMRRKKGQPTDYRIYSWKRGEFISALFTGIGIVSAIDWLFYKSLLLLPFLFPLVLLWIRLVKKEKAEARKKKLNSDFEIALHSMAMALRAGYSVENAFPQTARDLRSLLGENADMTREFTSMCAKIAIKIAPEDLLMDFGSRSGVEDIEDFAEVFACARRMGGDLATVLQNTSDVIERKIETEKAIDQTLAAKKFEQRIMAVMPCGIILYMRLGSPGYLDCLYGNAAGILIMSACLAVYILAILWGRRLVRIDI